MSGSSLDLSLLQGKDEDLEFRSKVESSIATIREAFTRPKEIGLAYNGGKDSIVILALIQHILVTEVAPVGNLHEGSKIQTVFFLNDGEYPEVVNFMWESAKSYGLDVVIKKNGFKAGLAELVQPSNDDLKQGKVPLKAMFMGVRKDDPSGKNLERFTPTDKGWPPLVRICPILDWHYHDIWKFINRFTIPYCCLYNHGFTSIGSRHDTLPNPYLWNIRTQSYDHPSLLTQVNSERIGRGCSKFMAQRNIRSFLDFPCAEILDKICSHLDGHSIISLWISADKPLRNMLNLGLSHFVFTRDPSPPESRSREFPTLKNFQHLGHFGIRLFSQLKSAAGNDFNQDPLRNACNINNLFDIFPRIPARNIKTLELVASNIWSSLFRDTETMAKTKIALSSFSILEDLELLLIPPAANQAGAVLSLEFFQTLPSTLLSLRLSTSKHCKATISGNSELFQHFRQLEHFATVNFLLDLSMQSSTDPWEISVRANLEILLSSSIKLSPNSETKKVSTAVPEAALEEWNSNPPFYANITDIY